MYNLEELLEKCGDVEICLDGKLFVISFVADGILRIFQGKRLEGVVNDALDALENFREGE